MVNTYIPVLRNGRNEEPVITNFNRASLSGSSSRAIELAPLVEITDESDLGDLETFRQAGQFLMVELPQYLTDRANKHNDDVREILDAHGSVEQFYLNNSTTIDIPVVSGSLDPVDYSEYLLQYESLKEEFDRVAFRLLMTDVTTELTGDQKDTLEELESISSSEDIFLFDLVDNGVEDELMKDLQYLATLFDGNTRAVLNVFDAYNEHPDNQSPRIADEIGASAFGDFAINMRFKPDGEGGPTTVKHRHYYPNHSTVEFFEGEGYDEAAADLLSWTEWDRTHCDGCRRASRTTSFDPNTWSQIKMEHYISSVLRGEI